MSFRSDNNAGLCREALEAIAAASETGPAVAYGDDPHTAEAIQEFRELFGPDTAVFFVATGTAANVLAVGALSEPWQRVICHRHSHLNEDESTAPERLTGCRLTAVESDATKVTVADIETCAANTRGDVHQPAPGVVSIANATELGSVYSPEELRELCRVAHAAGYRVHVDGARFANAVVSNSCTPIELAAEAGVDALSFGGTKNGLAMGEAVLFFSRGSRDELKRISARFEFLRKSSGHLLSKQRFVAAQFTATLRGGIWLDYARHANEMAARLAAGLDRLGVVSRFPVESNGVFVRFPSAVDALLKDQGYGYYPFGETAWELSRLMCSFDTTTEDVDALLRTVSGITT